MRRPRSIDFPLRCALAYAGGVIGYLPLLTLLLPARVAEVAGPDRFAVLARVLIVGAIAAGGGNVLFGWLSDRTRQHAGRRCWIAGGLIAMLACYAALPLARTPLAIGGVIAAYQFAINAVLAPLMALIAEEMPERQTGLTTGLFAAAPPIAALLSLGIASQHVADLPGKLAIVGAAAAVCILPLLASEARPIQPSGGGGEPGSPRRDLAVASLARLLVQIAGSVLFTDLLFVLDDRGAAGSTAMTRAGSLMLLGNLAPLPVAAAIGRWSDRQARRKPFLIVLAGLASGGLALMATVPSWPGRALGFVLFSIGWGAFLPLQVGQIMRVLPDPAHRGRDLGLVNLANTIPVVIGQALAWQMATPRHAGPLLMTLAGLTLAGGLTTLAVRGRR